MNPLKQCEILARWSKTCKNGGINTTAVVGICTHSDVMRHPRNCRRRRPGFMEEVSYVKAVLACWQAHSNGTLELNLQSGSGKERAELDLVAGAAMQSSPMRADAGPSHQALRRLLCQGHGSVSLLQVVDLERIGSCSQQLQDPSEPEAPVRPEPHIHQRVLSFIGANSHRPLHLELLDEDVKCKGAGHFELHSLEGHFAPGSSL